MAIQSWNSKERKLSFIDAGAIFNKIDVDLICEVPNDIKVGEKCIRFTDTTT